MEREMTDVQAGFRKGQRSCGSIVDVCWIIERAKEYSKEINVCFTNYRKVFIMSTI